MKSVKFSLSFLALAAVLSALFTACSDSDCTISNGVAASYVSKGDTLTSSLTVLAVRDGKPDTTILNSLQKVEKFSLPMSYSNDADELKFVFTDSLGVQTTDIVKISKTNFTHLEGVDCAPSFFHTITQVTATNNVIDHIDINNPNVDFDGNKENLYIYFKSGH